MRHSEFSFITSIAEQFKSLIPSNIEGIGDDCAIITLDNTHSMVVTTDMLVEDVHFTRSKISAYELGRKSVAVNLSDIAAMGACPTSIFLSLALPENISEQWCADFIDGIRSYNIPLLGGDTTRSPHSLVINITALGSALSSNIKRRSTAQVGDTIYVTSHIGDSAAGLLSDDSSYLKKAHNDPRPFLAEGAWLGARSEVHAMMDVSDGIASDLRHILRASNVGAKVDTFLLPHSAEFLTACQAHGWDSTKLSLEGGEDYCLLLTADRSLEPFYLAQFAAPLYPIGQITAAANLLLWLPQGNYQGFTHF